MLYDYHNIKIKEINDPRFSIALVEAVDGVYYIAYSTRHGYYTYSEVIRDFTTADMLFDMKRKELADERD